MKMQWPKGFKIRLTVLHVHYVGVALLCIVNLVLLTRVVLAWERVHAGDVEQLQQHEASYKAMMLKTKPLRGLDKKIEKAKSDQTAFYAKRFPKNYSTVAAELGALAVKNNVLLSRVQYAQGKPAQGLYVVQMDGSLTGDYAPIARFINDLERDKIFFVIDSIALTGQQGGLVNLRLRLTTYLQISNETFPPQTAQAASSTSAGRQ